MKIVIEVKSVEKKMSKLDKPYWEIETDKGKMTVHDEEIVKQLSAVYANNKFASVDMTESGDWKNIHKFFEQVELADTATYGHDGSGDKSPIATEKVPAVPGPKNTTMYVSYAKDIYIAQLQHAEDCNIDDAILLVKKAKAAFE